MTTLLTEPEKRLSLLRWAYTEARWNTLAGLELQKQIEELETEIAKMKGAESLSNQ